MSTKAEAGSKLAGDCAQDIHGHPRGLVFLVFTEAWERFSFYGMQALLVLYMVSHLLQPASVGQVVGFATLRATLEAMVGPLSTQALASQIFGLYGGLVYLLPILGGVLGDSPFGRRRAVSLGAACMVAGHFLMTIEAAFLPALLAILIGCGLLKGNIAAQVGALYDKDDARSDRAFSLYYLGINAGAFIAPLVCGTLGELYGWHYGFGAAGVGMVIGFVIYLAGYRHLPADRRRRRERGFALAQGDGRAIAGLAVMLVIATLFWIAVTQAWNSYPLWIRDRVDRAALGGEMPITWFQSLNSLLVLLMAPPVLWLWRRQAVMHREPGDLRKLAIGCFVFALSQAWLALAEIVSGDGRISIFWPAMFAMIAAVGYLYVAPIMIALFSRAAPDSLQGVMVSTYYVSIFLGSTISGWLGRFYALLPATAFWLLHGAIVASGTLFVLILSRPLGRALRVDSTAAGVIS